MKRWISYILTALILVTLLLSGINSGKKSNLEGSNSNTSNSNEPNGRNRTYLKFSYEFLGSFDTMIQFMGYAEDEQQFEAMSKIGQERYEELHKLFNIYDSYEGINNIKTINDKAGISPVEVSQEIIDLIVFCKQWYYKTDGVVNIALGPVLTIWHDYRDEGTNNPAMARIPDIELLKKAQLKTDIEKVEVNAEKKTVFLRETGMRLDVGAVAKGFATEIVATELEELGYTSFVISGGGNIKIVGQPQDGVRSKWGIGIQDPDGNALIPDSETIDVVYVNDTSVVSSGDYQRYYVVNGKRIHHLIDPKTLMPADYYRAVTVMTTDSGFADFLSTTVFLLPYEKSRALVESLEDVDALWILPDGTILTTENMKKSLKNLGGAISK